MTVEASQNQVPTSGASDVGSSSNTNSSTPSILAKPWDFNPAPMKRSIQVAAPLLAAAALAMTTGCRKPEMQRCVDEHNIVVDDSHCTNLPQQGLQQQRPDGHGGFLPLFIPYHYYYGGFGGYGLGSTVGGGGSTPIDGRSYANSAGRTTRGGFGSSFSKGGIHASGGEGAGE